MLFGLSKKRIITDEVLYINSIMSWAEHIHYIKCKIHKGIGILCKARKVQKINIIMSLLLFYISIFYILY